MAATIATAAPARAAKPWYKVLYIQVLIAIVLGVVVGWLWPDLATNDWIKALGDGFIKLIKMVIAPIIFCTVVSGIAHIQDARKVGRIGVKALVYFEIVSTFALIIGLASGIWSARRGLWRRMADAAAVASYAKQAERRRASISSCTSFPTPWSAPSRPGEILQVLLFSILFGFSLMALGERGHTSARPHRRRGAWGFRRHRHRHEGRADRRVRRDGLHHRQVRHRRHSAIWSA